jgi:hypothetical protein
MLGATLTRQILDFFSIFRGIAEDYVVRARRTVALLRDPQVTTFTVVTTPFKARRDGDFFCDELGRRQFPVGAMVVNRVWPVLPTSGAALSPQMQQVAGWYQDTSEAHRRAGDQVRGAFAERIPTLMEIPELPADVDGLAALHRLAAHL